MSTEVAGLEYNTARKKLIIKEYGRNIQKMIESAKGIEDKAERTRFCYLIIQIMEQVQPNQEGVDYKRKLWDHLHIIANFELDIDLEYPKPIPEDIVARPKPLVYNKHTARYKQYGKNIEFIIDKTVDIENLEQQKFLTLIIANHMKKLYLNWNRESVSDELINQHLQLLSGGKLVVETEALQTTSDILARGRKKKAAPSQSQGRPQNGGKHQYAYRGTNKRRK